MKYKNEKEIKLYCTNLLKRQKHCKTIFYCKIKKSNIISLEFCKNCSDFNFKRNKAISKRSAKQNKLEKERDSKLIKKGYCENCHKYCENLDAHEVYGGSNRKRSIENGFVALLCRNCHSNEQIILNLKIKYQKEYEKTHTRDEFIKIIGKNYMKES